MKLQRIVSGGQTGADRAALDAAIACGVEYGGWCAKGGRAEDFRTPPGLLLLYPFLKDTHSSAASLRAEWNVRDSDATLILSLAKPAPSSESGLALRLAKEMGRPHLVLTQQCPIEMARDFLEQTQGEVLNVSGPSESEAKGTYDWALSVMSALLSRG